MSAYQGVAGPEQTTFGHTVVDLFRAQVSRTPSALALCGDEVLTYAELDRRSNQLARHLLGAGVRAGDRIGLYGDRRVGLVVAMLGILKTGAAYVPLDPGLPAARLAAIATDAELRLLLVGGDRQAPVSGVPAIRLVEVAPAVAALPGTDPRVEVRPDDVAYVPFTSGSTGRPKGTVVPHRSIPGFALGDEFAEWGPGSVVVHHSSISWDGHVLDIYPALLTGGTVAVHTGAGDPAEVARYAAECGATVLWLTAAAFNVVVDTGLHALRGLRQLLVGGEKLSSTHVARAVAELPGTRIVNGYGPSECTVFSSVRVVTEADLAGDIPIGRPVGDRTVHLLDATGAEVPDGTTGEIHVGGPGVGLYYLGRPGLTAERFLPDPFRPGTGARLYRTGDLARRRQDGALMFEGRTDDQVKIRGVRVEPGELTELLREHPDVRDAAVVPHLDDAGRCVALHAYVVPAGGRVDVRVLRGHLAERVAEAMMPAAVVVLSELPLTSTGKLDRRALPAPDSTDLGSRAAYEPPATATETFLANAWTVLLEVTQVGRQHDFFALGGQSLLAARLVARIRQRYGIELPVRSVYRLAALAALATEVDRLVAERGDVGPGNSIPTASRTWIVRGRPAERSMLAPAGD